MTEIFTDAYNEGYERGLRVFQAMREKLTIEGKSADEILRAMADVVEQIKDLTATEIQHYLTKLEEEWLND